MEDIQQKCLEWHHLLHSLDMEYHSQLLMSLQKILQDSLSLCTKNRFSVKVYILDDASIERKVQVENLSDILSDQKLRLVGQSQAEAINRVALNANWNDSSAQQKRRSARKMEIKNHNLKSQGVVSDVKVETEEQGDCSLHEVIDKEMSSLRVGQPESDKEVDNTSDDVPEDSGSEWEPVKEAISKKNSTIKSKRRKKLRGCKTESSSDDGDRKLSDEECTDQFICIFCEDGERKQFTTTRYIEHVKNKHTQQIEDDTVMWCKFCMTSFKSAVGTVDVWKMLDDCIEHMQNKHGYAPPAASNKTDTAHCKRTLHGRKVKSSRIKGYKMKTAKTSDESRNMSKRNTTIVEGDFKFPCFSCHDETNLTSWQHCRVHFREVHLIEESDKWVLNCPQCTQKFKYSKAKSHCDVGLLVRNLISHLNKLHKFPIPPCFATYKCPDCSFTSIMNKNVIKHINRGHCKTEISQNHVEGSPKREDSEAESNRTDENQLDQEEFARKCQQTARDENFSFICFQCDEEKLVDITSWKHCKEHIREAHVEEDDNKWWLTCRTCGRCLTCSKLQKSCNVSQLIQSLLHHMSTCHDFHIPPCLSLYECNECMFKSVARTVMQQHIRKMHNIKRSTPKSQCEKCGRLVSRWSMNTHRHFCPGEPVKPKIPCSEPDCGKTFSTSQSLSKHVNCVHRKLKEHLCDICAKAFPKKYTLEVHKFRVHNINESGKEVETCPICNYETFAGYEMSVHMKHIHREGVYPCKHCGESFDRYKKLSHHNYKYHSDHPTHQCDDCDYKTDTRRQLLQHIACKHRGQEIQCKICSYRALTEESLKMHMAQKHPNGVPEGHDPNPFHCSYCDQKFHTKHIVEVHTFTMHRKNITKKEVITCNLCPWQTISKAMYRTHMLNKHEQGNHTCNICNKVFNCKSKLRYHTLRSHPRGGYKCEMCDYVTDLASHFKLHMARKHGGQRLKCPRCKYYTFYNHLFIRHMKDIHDVEVLEEAISDIAVSNPVKGWPLQAGCKRKKDDPAIEPKEVKKESKKQRIEETRSDGSQPVQYEPQQDSTDERQFAAQVLGSLASHSNSVEPSAGAPGAPGAYPPPPAHSGMAPAMQHPPQGFMTSPNLAVQGSQGMMASTTPMHFTPTVMNLPQPPAFQIHPYMNNPGFYITPSKADSHTFGAMQQ